MKREKGNPEGDILEMENYLGRLMAPVRPRDEFVQELRCGLGQVGTIASQQEDLSFLAKLFWVMLGFVCASLFLTMGIRALVKLVRNSKLNHR